MLSLRVNHALLALPLWTGSLPSQAFAEFRPAESPSSTACVIMQGNGEKFPALLAQLMAVLERDIEPQVIMGGSSASGVSSILRALLQNPSLLRTTVAVDGRSLSLAQKAARVIASSSAVTSTGLALPSLNTFGKTLTSLGKYLAADRLLEAFIGYPDQSLGALEATVGQTALMVEFFANADFSQAIREPNLSKRTALVRADWLEFGDHIFVTPSEFSRALITAPGNPRWTERVEEIKRRYFDLFYDEKSPPDERPALALKRYNRKLEELAPLLAAVSDEDLLKAFNAVMGLLKNLPSMSSKALGSAEGFYLVNGSYLRNAYHGLLHDGSGPMAIPSGVLIHATARAASMKDGKLREKTGLKYLYQSYFPSQDLYRDLASARQKLAEDRSFIESTNDAGTVEALFDKDHLLVLEPKSLAQALKASMAEPNAFRRDPIELSSRDRRANDLVSEESTLVSYGGWLEHANLRSLGSLETCKKADLLIEVSNLSPQLYKFQLKAIRPVIAGGIGSLVSASAGGLAASDEPAKLWTNQLWKAFYASRELRVPEKFLLLDFDWDNASGLDGSQADGMNAAYQDNRDAFFVRAYQDASEKLQQSGILPAELSAKSIIGADLNGVPLKSILEPSLLVPTVAELMQ